MSSLTTAGSGMDQEEVFDTRLCLEIGETSRSPPQMRQQTTVRLFGELISPPQEDAGDRDRRETRATEASRKKRAESSVPVGSTGGKQSNKKARTTLQAEDDGVSRKKLRLTSAQATMLEDSFRARNILSHAQKQELARRVGLSARQVEVWFQNRRARTKLKQTEVDCELLRRWCDRLTDENARLRHDLAELRAAAAGGRLPAVSVVCPSCCGKNTMAVVAGDVA